MAQQAAAVAIVSWWSSKSTVPRVIAEGDRLRHSKFVAQRDDKDLREGVRAKDHEWNRVLDVIVSPGSAIRGSPPKCLRQEMCEAAKTRRR